MPLSALRIPLRLAAGLVLMGIMALMTNGTFLGGDRSVIQIEFGMYPEEFEGLEVVIDDRSAGKLQYFGRATRTGFEVEHGRHKVEVVHPEFESVPATVAAGPQNSTVLLLLDYGSINMPDGSYETAVVLTR